MSQATDRAPELKFCSTCLNFSTRPRITFDSLGRCNACQWAEEKKNLDWSTRRTELLALLEKGRSSAGGYDCLVPVSGGKDGSYVAYSLKHKLGMNPLCITVRPAMETELGRKNLEAFINSGYDHITISPDPQVMRIINREGFVRVGFPYYGWLLAIMTAVVNFATDAGISLIFYGEDGEVEYGGSSETRDHHDYSLDYMRRVYYEGHQDEVLRASGLTESSLQFFKFSDRAWQNQKLTITHWSYFEDWDPYRNYLVAKEFCGLQESPETNESTFTNFAQNDQSLYPLHTYLMYLKYGFGRATQDANIEIRRGALSRTQGLNLARMFDGQFPNRELEAYCDYFGMSHEQFQHVLMRHTNSNLFEWKEDRPVPKFQIA